MANEIIIPFNKPYLTGKEGHYIYQAVLSGKISGDGIFTKRCHEYFEKRFGFKKCLLTTSCTDALEMAALLINIEPGGGEQAFFKAETLFKIFMAAFCKNTVA